MHVAIGLINDDTRAFGPFDDADDARNYLIAKGYTSPLGGKYYGEGTGRNSTLFQIVPVESPDALVPRM